jgi:multiple RNA-binding domain-containing protein 1
MEAASSRIFVKGLPPTFSETDFRKHFSQGREVTDAKIFPNRRIGYVGYKTPEDAQKAVKYFNKTFIRMSRIGVELARPIQDTKPEKKKQGSAAPTARRDSSGAGQVGDENVKKRKRESEGKEEADPKLKEFLDAYKPKSKKRAWEAEGLDASEGARTAQVQVVAEPAAEDQSDGEYEDVPKKTKRAKHESGQEAGETAEPTEQSNQMDVDEPQRPPEDAEKAPQQPVSDADWARSRTSRLLGLLDEDEEEANAAARKNDAVESHSDNDPSDDEAGPGKQPPNPMPTPPSDEREKEKPDANDNDDSSVRNSMRLFVRNLPYDVKHEDLKAEFEAFGALEEVSSTPFSHRFFA